jgi:peptide deformylase
MAILKVARMGHPVLRKKAKKVDVKEINSSEFQKFIDDMVDTMREYEGIGLAAPQVHESIRVSVIELPEDNKRYPKDKYGAAPQGLEVFINPTLEFLTKEVGAYWEGCLSVPGLRGLVARPNKVKVSYLDRKGNSREFIAEGFLATVLQHEFDHLDGVLYIDKLVDSTKFVFEQEFDKYWLPDAEDGVLED